MHKLIRNFVLALVLVLAVVAWCFTIALLSVHWFEPLYLVPLTFFPSLGYWAYNVIRGE